MNLKTDIVIWFMVLVTFKLIFKKAFFNLSFYSDFSIILMFRKGVGEFFLVLLLFDVNLKSYDLVSMKTVAISFERSCKINCLLFQSKSNVGHEC